MHCSTQQTSTGWFRHVNERFRAIAIRPLQQDTAVITSSTMPSAKPFFPQAVLVMALS